MKNPELGYKPLWLATGAALVALIVYLSVTPAPMKLDTGLDWQDKLFHVLAYLTLMGWFVQIYHDTRYKLVLALVFSGIGVGMEFIQSLMLVRYFEYADMIANVVGVVIGYLLSLTPLRFVLLRFEHLLFKR